jgi:hypothetical protein
MMTQQQILEYVKAAAAAVDLPLDDAAAQRVAEHLARTADLARQLDDVDLDAHDEIAEIFRPAPFPNLESTQ